MIVLGISSFYHDSAAALIKDGNILSACQEERFSRIKGDPSFPTHSIKFCLNRESITVEQIDHIVFYEKPLLTFDRLIETYLAFVPHGIKSFTKAFPIWVKEKLFLKEILYKELTNLDLGKVDKNKILFSSHHHSHAASGFFPSPFKKAAILVMDGVGEWATTTLAHGINSQIHPLKEIRFPHSLGLLYSAFTYYLGFKVNEGEYKVMGLAPYGEPQFKKIIYDHLIDLKEDGSFRLNMEYFAYCTGLTMTGEKFNRLFVNHPPRLSDAPLRQRDMDIAASIQAVTEEVILKLCRTLHKETGEQNLCMAGGVSLNCVANGKILREGPFKNIWIQPASGDAGGALGAALAIHHLKIKGRPHTSHNMDSMQGSLLGPDFRDTEIQKILQESKWIYHQLKNDRLFEIIAEYLAAGNVVGWFQGRMEYGPRSLGNRSILADANNPDMQKRVNLKIKFRESFRPFAPAILKEDVSEYFELKSESPYMLFVSHLKQKHRKKLNTSDSLLKGLQRLHLDRGSISSAIHVDYSARIQTVDHETNPRFHKLLQAFKKITQIGLLLNTSFNIRDEPIVCTPEDALNCFMATDLDILVMNNFLLLKKEQISSPPHESA